MNAYIPVDIRSGSQSGSRMTNQFALVFLNLPVDNSDMLKVFSLFEIDIIYLFIQIIINNLNLFLPRLIINYKNHLYHYKC